MDKEEIYEFLKDRFSEVEDHYLKSLWEDEFVDEYQDTIGFYCWESGSSKLVLFFEEITDYVVKVPFSGETLDHFYRNGGFVNNWDYCEYEAFIYDQAVENGLSDMFAGTYFLGYVGAKNNIPIYISEIADSTPVRRPRSEYCFKIPIDVRIDASKADITTDARDSLYLSHGFDKLKEFIKFAIEYSINDIRSSNIGYLKDGTCVVIDYSGWDDNENDYSYESD